MRATGQVLRRLAVVAAGLLALLPAQAAQAHLTPNSELRLDVARAAVTVDLLIPLAELGYAMGSPLAERPVTDPPSPAPAAADAYVLPRLAVRAPDGRPWIAERLGSRIVADAGGPDYVIRVRMTPPPGADPRRFDLTDAAVIDRVRNHVALVLVRTDYAGGQLSETPRLLGGLQWNAATLRVDLGAGAAWRGFGAAVALGMRHIAEGYDHLLFLMALLLPAPLLAAGGVWTAPRPAGAALRRVAAVVTAFTVGHSLTLVAGAGLGLRLPAQPVEAAIAASILVSAAHAARPLFPGREPWMAAGFGLIHGMAFATVVGQFGLDPLENAQAVLGFNLGIELVQLLVVAAVAPWLLALARSPAYGPLRLTAAALTGVAAALWLAERSLGVTLPAARLAEAVVAHAAWAYPALAAGGLLVILRRRRAHAA